MKRFQRRRRSRKLIEGELQILPMMNLFVVLIPMLLLSAVFLRMAVINMSFPSENAKDDSAEGLDLAVRIQDDGYVVEWRGAEPVAIPRSTEPDDMGHRLAALLTDIAAAHPDERSVTIVSMPNTVYDEIIRVMDISRGAGLPGASLLSADRAGGGKL